MADDAYADMCVGPHAAAAAADSWVPGDNLRGGDSIRGRDGIAGLPPSPGGRHRSCRPCLAGSGAVFRWRTGESSGLVVFWLLLSQGCGRLH
jgi:hypothetical protein